MLKLINKEYLISSLRDFNEKVLSKLYAKIPKNQSVLDKLDEADGNLLFNGETIDGNGTPGKDGVNGKSAYEIAVQNGFAGTEQEWLESLKGNMADVYRKEESDDKYATKAQLSTAVNATDALTTRIANVETNVAELNNQSDQDTWKANTASSEGYVTSGANHANQVWKTDADGNPAWRNESFAASLLSQTLTAGETTLTFTSDVITDDSLIEVYTDTYGVCPSAITQDGNTLTLTFDAQSADVTVKVRVM